MKLLVCGTGMLHPWICLDSRFVVCMALLLGKILYTTADHIIVSQATRLIMEALLRQNILHRKNI